jgi:hypothetical protein
MGMVRWPKAPWFQRAKREFLMFPNGKHDDFVDAASWLGMGVNTMVGGKRVVEAVFEEPIGFNITPRSIKEYVKREKRIERLALDR